MNTALWIIAVILAAAFIAAGAMKLARTRQEMAAAGMDWADDLSDGQVKAIGLVEVLGGIVDIAPVLVPLAATGLAVTMAGAAVFHIRRNDPLASLAPSLLLGALAIVVAVGRFGPEAF